MSEIEGRIGRIEIAAAYGQCRQPEGSSSCTNFEIETVHCSGDDKRLVGHVWKSCRYILQFLSSVFLCEICILSKLSLDRPSRTCTRCPFVRTTPGHTFFHQLFLNVIQTGGNDVGLERELHHGNWFGS